MRHWQDKGTNRIARWIVLAYALAASALTIYGSFLDVREIWVAAFFVISSALIIMPKRFEGGWVIATALIILTPTLLTPVSHFTLNDSTVGRFAKQIQLLGAPVYTTYHESELTNYYRQCVNKELPKPNWSSRSGYIISIFPGNMDFFGPSISFAGEEFKQTFDRYKPSEEIKAHIIKTFFQLNSRSDDSYATVMTYTDAVTALFDEKNGNVLLSDLANPDKMIEEETKNQKEKLSETG
jgi:hypothetical protein